MSIDDYLKLPETAKLQFQSSRCCPECNTPCVHINAHSAGNLHVICPTCRSCPDCEDGE